MNYDFGLKTQIAKINDLTCVSQEDHSNQFVCDDASIDRSRRPGRRDLARAYGHSRARCFRSSSSVSLVIETANFFGATLQRLNSKSAFSAPVIVCNNDHRFLVKEEVERAGITPRAIILEPVARNTATGDRRRGALLEHREPGAILAVMPSDHVLKERGAIRGSGKEGR